MSAFNWLHLTDLHWGVDGLGSLWPNLREAFFNDLARLHERCGPFQAVFFTGDLVQQGKQEEFAQLEEKVLGPLWEQLQKLGSGDAALLAVPGNHDLIRPDAKKPSAAARWLLKPEIFGEIADEMFTGDGGEYRRVIGTAFTDYSQWWDGVRKRSAIMFYEGTLPGDMSATLEVDGKRIGVMGLNSTFLQLAGGGYQGRLVLDHRQFHGACGGDGPAWIGQHDVCLLLTHQGPDWLNQQSLKNEYPEINPAGRFAVHLFGHMHEATGETRIRGGGRGLRQWQGCSLCGLEKYGDPPKFDRRHGYSAGQINIQKARATIRQWPRMAVMDDNGWRMKPDDGPDRFVLRDDQGTDPEPITLLRHIHKVVSPKGSGKSNSAGPSAVERQALEAYVNAARQLWDIIDLAGLPEDDRHLAMKKFFLRQLYAPLRLTMDVLFEFEQKLDADPVLSKHIAERWPPLQSKSTITDEHETSLVFSNSLGRQATPAMDTPVAGTSSPALYVGGHGGVGKSRFVHAFLREQPRYSLGRIMAQPDELKTDPGKKPRKAS
jgi:hypothetical protein